MQKRIILGLRACTWVWILMMMLSLATYIIGQQGLSGLRISLLVLAFALLKGQLVSTYFSWSSWVAWSARRLYWRIDRACKTLLL
jgi:cytochrome c oxidase subunit IV